MLGLTLPQWLGFTAVAAVVTVTGNLVALYLKEVLAARSLERWKARETLLGAYRRYQIPLFYAARELSIRCHRLSRDDRDDKDRPEGKVGLEIMALPEHEERLNAAIGPHYLRYHFMSNAYRLCSFLAWLELYRRDIETLDVGVIDRSRRLQRNLESVQDALANGWLNKHKDWDQWRDVLIFREEQRAIGHRMIVPADHPCVMDFGTFCEILELDPAGKSNARWFVQAASFFEHLQAEKDFRRVRMKLLVARLTDLMDLLQPERTLPEFNTTARTIDAWLPFWTGEGPQPS